MIKDANAGPSPSIPTNTARERITPFPRTFSSARIEDAIGIFAYELATRSWFAAEGVARVLPRERVSPCRMNIRFRTAHKRVKYALNYRRPACPSLSM